MLSLKVETFVSSFFSKTAKIFVLGLVVFTKNLKPVLGLAKGSTLRLVGSGLKNGRHKLFSFSKFEMDVNKV